MNKIKQTFLFFQLFFIHILLGQSYQEKQINYELDFHPPMKIDLILSGNFCELRSNHFHTGIDIKTQGVEGIPVYAVEDGFISRLKISPYGYGNAIYIDHPNDITSLYAHLKSFAPKIDSLAYQIQRTLESAVIDQNCLEFKIPVKKGEFIGYSGNTGGSFAPHLHFELRQTSTEHALNALLFKSFQKRISDKTSPEIRGLKLYAISPNGYLIPGKSIYFSSTKKNNTYEINGNATIIIDELLTQNSMMGIGIYAIDKLDAASNVCGIFKTEIYKDEVLIHSQKMEYMNFDYNRFLNSHTDYWSYKQESKHIHKQFSTVVNPLPIYPLNGGKIDWDKVSGNYKIEVWDAYLNKSTFIFTVEKSSNEFKENVFNERDKYFFPDTVNLLMKHNFQVLMETGVFYEPVQRIYKEIKEENSNYLSPVFEFNEPNIPVQKKYDMRIKIDNLPANFPIYKLCIIQIDDKNRKNFIGGDYVDGWLEAHPKVFGKFTVMVDSIPPTIQPLDFNEGKVISKYKTLELKIFDDLSWVTEYKAFINGNWVLMEYNKKLSKYVIPLDHRSKIYLKAGENKVKITAKDAKNNLAEYKAVVIY